MKRMLRVIFASLLATTAIATAAPQSAAAAPVTYTGARGKPTIGLIGDSSLAGVVWTNQFGPLQVFNYRYDAESCRRTIGTSCRGRNGVPSNAINAMRAGRGKWGEVLVMVTGYNDSGTTFASAVDAVMAEAKAQNIPHVMWLTMRTADVEYVSPTFTSTTYTFRDNNRILLQKAAQYGDRLQIADWATHTKNRPEWFSSDGVHYKVAGARAASSFIAQQAQKVIDGKRITPTSVPTLTQKDWVTLRQGDRGTRVTNAQRSLINAGISLFGGNDGIFGAYTTAAVREYQARNGLTVNGTFDKPTAIKLGLFKESTGSATTTTVAAPTTTAPAGNVSWSSLVVGSRGNGVAAAQQALIRAGVSLFGGADGIYGSYTAGAVRIYQGRNGLTVNGRIDRATATKLGLLGTSSGGGTSTPTTWTTLSVGSRGTSVARAQRAIMSAGIYLRGGADGIFGPVTQAALQTYQQRKGLTASGKVDRETAVKMGLVIDTSSGGGTATPTTTSSGTTTAWVNVQQPQRGTRVASAQRALINAGIYVRGGADGIFGPVTKAAVQSYQRANGLTASGVVDQATAIKLGLHRAPVAARAAAAAAAPSRAPVSATTTTEPTSTTTGPPTTTESVSTTTVAPPTTDSAAALTSAPDTTVPTSTGSINGVVWDDANGDGIRGDAESPLADVEVRLMSDGEVVDTVITALDGSYTFAEVIDGEYSVAFMTLEFFAFAPTDQGADDTVDSDAVLDTAGDGTTAAVTIVVSGNQADNVDAGLTPA